MALGGVVLSEVGPGAIAHEQWHGRVASVPVCLRPPCPETQPPPPPPRGTQAGPYSTSSGMAAWRACLCCLTQLQGS